MSLLNYKKHWINALGTYDFFDAIQYGIYTVPNRTRRLYRAMKDRTYNPPDHHKLPMSSLRILHPELVRKIDSENMVTLKFPTKHHKAQPASLLEAFLTFSGGTYKQAGFRGGGGAATRRGFERRIAKAGELMYRRKPRLTAWDYRKVLAQLRPHDVAYLDPPYRGANVKSYTDRTMDFPGLVKCLLTAPYKWVLSEYDNEVYRPLTKKFGEPLRIKVQRTMDNSNQMGGKRRKVVECLWKNF